MSGKFMMNGIEYLGGGSGGGGGNVDDVYVNGESVLDENKIAQVTSYKEVTLAEYMALPDTKLNDGVMYCIKDVGGANQFPPLIYSDEEREVGVWRDGKPLYQKSYHFEGVLNQDVLIDSTVTQTDNELVNVFGSWAVGTYHYANSRQASIFETIKFLNNTTPHPIVFVDSSGLYYNSNQNNFGFHMYLTIQYTKTTDTPGSGKWSPTGLPSKHYSTEEQVVGTWIDGKPLYEKCFEFLSALNISNTSFTETTIDSRNIDNVISCIGINMDGTNYGTLMADPTRSSHTKLGLQTMRNDNTSNCKKLILQYTKITD